MRTRARRLVVGGIVAALASGVVPASMLPASPAAASPLGVVYQLVDLGTLQPMAINGDGDVGGALPLAASGPSGQTTHSAVYDSDTDQLIDLDAGASPPRFGAVTGMDDDWIAGVQSTVGGAQHGYRMAGDDREVLASESYLHDINELGLAVGSTDVVNQDTTYTLGIGWRGGDDVTSLGTLATLPLPVEGLFSIGTDVNSNDVVVGFSAASTGSPVGGFLRNLSSGDPISPLDIAASGSEFPYAINDENIVVGLLETEDPPTQLPFRFDVGASADPLLLLDLPAGAQTGAAKDLNDAGTIVGSADGGGVIWTDDGEAHLASDVVINDAGWTLGELVAINESGQIAGSGTRNGEPRGFRLDPVDGVADLRLTATRAPAIARVNEVVTYRLRTVNEGTVPASASEVVMILQAPAQTAPTVVSAPSGCTTGSVALTVIVRCPLGELAVGQVTTTTIRLRWPLPGTYSRSAFATTTSPETDTADNGTTLSVRVRPTALPPAPGLPGGSGNLLQQLISFTRSLLGQLFSELGGFPPVGPLRG